MSKGRQRERRIAQAALAYVDAYGDCLLAMNRSNEVHGWAQAYSKVNALYEELRAAVEEG